MVSTAQLLKKLQLLETLLKEEGIGDDVLDRTIAKLPHYGLDKLKERQHQIRDKLTVFEKRYSLTTDEFIRRFREGTMGDQMDFFEWSALADMDRELAQRLTEAERISHGSSHQDDAQ